MKSYITKFKNIGLLELSLYSAVLLSIVIASDECTQLICSVYSAYHFLALFLMSSCTTTANNKKSQAEDRLGIFYLLNRKGD